MNWTTIGTVQGQGTSFQTINYEFIDESLEGNESVIYYRLKQVDYNGQFEYSAIRTLNIENAGFGPSTPFSIFPNPSNTGAIYISTLGTYRLLSTTGKVVKPYQETTLMDVSNLKPGTYIVESTRGITQLCFIK